MDMPWIADETFSPKCDNVFLNYLPIADTLNNGQIF